MVTDATMGIVPLTYEGSSRRPLSVLAPVCVLRLEHIHTWLLLIMALQSTLSIDSMVNK